MIETLRDSFEAELKDPAYFNAKESAMEIFRSYDTGVAGFRFLYCSEISKDNGSGTALVMDTVLSAAETTSWNLDVPETGEYLHISRHIIGHYVIFGWGLGCSIQSAIMAYFCRGAEDLAARLDYTIGAVE